MLIFGHRGARAEAPENTVAGFVHAYEQGIRHFELDLQLSSDGEIIVIHDKTVERTTGQPGKVAEMTSAQLTQLDARHNTPPWHDPAPIPTLADIFSACPDIQKIQLEVKSDKRERLNILCNRLVEMIQRENRMGQVVVTSSSVWVIQQIKRLNAHIETGYVAEYRFPSPLGVALKYKCEYLCINWKICTAEIVVEAHKQNMHVSTWTVNALPDMLNLQQQGVDSIITDYPTNTLRYMKKHQPDKVPVV
jgi:glycerophosphoryl diester phosphodiesterase